MFGCTHGSAVLYIEPGSSDEPRESTGRKVYEQHLEFFPQEQAESLHYIIRLNI